MSEVMNVGVMNVGQSIISGFLLFFSLISSSSSSDFKIQICNNFDFAIVKSVFYLRRAYMPNLVFLTKMKFWFLFGCQLIMNSVCTVVKTHLFWCLVPCGLGEICRLCLRGVSSTHELVSTWAGGSALHWVKGLFGTECTTDCK